MERNKLVKARFSKFIAENDIDTWHRFFLKVLNHGEKQICTLMLIRGDGSVFPARLECIRITGISDGTTTVRVALNDITDIREAEDSLRESEEKYRGLFAAESDGIFVVDRETGTIVDCNDAITPMYGHRKDEVIGRPYTIYVKRTGCNPCLDKRGHRIIRSGITRDRMAVSSRSRSRQMLFLFRIAKLSLQRSGMSPSVSVRRLSACFPPMYWES